MGVTPPRQPVIVVVRHRRDDIVTPYSVLAPCSTVDSTWVHDSNNSRPAEAVHLFETWEDVVKFLTEFPPHWECALWE